MEVDAVSTYACFWFPAILQDLYGMHASNCNAHCLPGKAKFCRAHIQPVGIKGHTCMGVDDPVMGLTHAWVLPVVHGAEFTLIFSRRSRASALQMTVNVCSLPAWRWPQNRKTEAVCSLLLSVLCAYRKAKWCSHQELLPGISEFKFNKWFYSLTSSVALGLIFFISSSLKVEYCEN